MFDRTEITASGMLSVAGEHRIYWEESGIPDGIPAVYLHGGPGSGLGPGGYRMKFDPDRFRIIGFDQRGCGTSRPQVTSPGYDLSENTTPHLIDDIEQLREYLQVDRWLINGASWGCTLALAYAQAHAERVLGIVLMAVTTTNRFEVDWITETVGAIYPEAWDRLAQHAEQAGIGYRRGEGRIVEAYARLMTHPDPAVRDAASYAWVEWEDQHVSIGSNGVGSNGVGSNGIGSNGVVSSDPSRVDYEQRHAFATLVTHYWSHDGFLSPPILDEMARLQGIDATLIHGRRDVSGPAVVPWRLHHAWPGSELIIVEDEGHGGESMVEQWCAANSRHADRIAALA